MVKVKIGNLKLDLVNELINGKLNLQSILLILISKGIITQKEFDDVKGELLAQLKQEHPEIFKKKDS